MNRLFYLLFFLGNLWSGALYAQSPEIRFHHIGLEEGLSHSLVSTFAEDSLGFLWMGTQDGLNRFDGYEFKTYFKGDDQRSPSDSWINKVYVDRDNQIWVWYSGSGGLDRYDPKTETFHPYKADPEKEGSISSTEYTTGSSLRFTKFFEDSKGRLWIGTRHGLNLYLRESDSFKSYLHDPEDPASLSSNEITAMCEGRNGKLWVGTTHGLNLLDPETGQVRRFMAREGSDQHLTHNSVSYLFAHPDGSLWVGSSHGGLNILEDPLAERTRVHHLVQEPLNPNYEPNIHNIIRTERGDMLVATIHGLLRIYRDGKTYREFLFPETRNISIFHMLQDIKGYVWLASNQEPGTNLFRLSPDLAMVDVFRPDEQDPFGFKGGKVQFLEESRTGLLWIGSEKEGVYMVDLNAHQFRTIDNLRDRGLYISNKEVYSIYEDEEQQLYVGTKTELNRIHLRSGRTRTYGNYRDLKTGISWEYSNRLSARLIGVIEGQPDGKIWLGSFDYKISLYDPSRENFLNFHHHQEDPESFLNWSLRSICVTRGGEVYFGAMGEENGFCRLKEDGRSFEYFPVVATGESGGPNDKDIQYIYEDKEGILWLGTLDKGLNRFDPATGRFEHFVNDPENPKTLSNNRVRCILEPEIHGRDILWIGTKSGGLNRFDKRTGEFTAYTIDDGLPSNTLHGILEDKVGKLWLSTNHGLVQFDPVTEKSIVYTAEDGLVGNEFNEGAFFKNREGIMYFGGTNGINYFDPADIREKPIYHAPVVLTKMSLGGEQVNPGEWKGDRMVLERSVAFTDEIHLSYRDRVISFEFAALDFVAPGKIKYQYMLENFDEGWNEVDAGQRFINYTNIPSGEYVLRIKGTNSDGTWSNQVTELSILVQPPFWRTVWFRLVIVAFILLVFMVFVQVRTRILENQKLTLAREVEERTRDLKEANLMLEKRNLEIQTMAEKLHESDQMKLKFFTNISHEFRTPLTLILGPTEKLLNKSDYTNTESVRKDLELMYRNQRRLFRLINQLLEVRTVESGNLKLTVAEEDLADYLNKLYQLFIPYAEKKQIDFRFHSEPDSILIHFDADKMEKIFYNLLSNAFKYTPTGGRIDFSLRIQSGDEGKWLEAEVADNGPGIPEKHRAHIFDRFYQISSKHQSGRISSGIGLSLSRDLVEKHHGRIEVNSIPGEGTRFKVYLPFDSKVYAEDEVLVNPEKEISMDYLQSMLETYQYSDGDTNAAPLVGEEIFKILVLEDNLDMQKFLSSELSSAYQVMLAQNGKEGLEIIEKNHPDLIISDLMMPEMDGIEFCQAIKEDPQTSHIPFILLTAKTAGEDQLRGFEMGAVDYITKPFNPELLKLKIHNILAGRKQLADKFKASSNYIPENIKISEIDQGFLERFVKLVEDNIDDTELSGDRLACELGMSKGNLYKKLKTLTGMTVNIYVRTIRLKMAARLLQQGNYNISEVAYAVGFNNPKYFSTCFSDMFKVSPKEYRK